MLPPQSRFKVLDAWRGLSAFFVALFHLQAYSHFYELSLLRHSFLFVDFFFVLSGFVITANYRTRLMSGFSFWHFMLLRFGRLYPLHLATLLALILLECVRYKYNGTLGGEIENKFSGPQSVQAMITNLFLVHALDVHKMLTWNPPSWSVSVEFYTYVIFAIVLLFPRSRIYLFVIFVILVSPIVLFMLVGNIDAQYDFGIVRSLLGFFVGFVCYDLHLAIGQRKNPPIPGILDMAEILCIGIVIAFVCFFGEGTPSLGAPGIFGIAVLTFSFEGGFVSKILKATPFVFLGMISYSIYMVHALVELGMRYALQVAEKKTGIVLFKNGFIGAEPWQGDLAYIVALSLLVSVSYLTYSFIEKPGRRKSRLIADRIFCTVSESNPLASGSSFKEIESEHLASPAVRI
jgi:peptidoglycan/LPS O-acetylase OafA/YrhL